MTFSLHAPRSTEAELNAFESVCARLSGFDEHLNFERVDGFLSALAAAPRLPADADWLSALAADTFERVFADPVDHDGALQVLQRRLKVLCAQLDSEALFEAPEALHLEPLVAASPPQPAAPRAGDDASPPPVAEAGTDTETGAEWARGFLAAVAAFPALWTQPADPEAAEPFEQAFAQIRALTLAADDPAWQAHLARFYAAAEGQALSPLPTRDDLLAEACLSVQDLRMYWVDFAPRPETRRVAPAPGRNDPCPCGSGRKFKKCHGATAAGG